MYLEEEKTVHFKITLTREEARMLKGLVQNPPEEAGLRERAFCEELFELLKEF